MRRLNQLKYPLRETVIAAEHRVIRLDNTVYGILKKLRRGIKIAKREDIRVKTLIPIS